MIGAAVGGAAGAALWAVIAITTGYEVGYVAWAVGGMIVGGAMLMGGKGQATGLMCAGLSLVAIFAGKVVTVYYTVPGMIEKEMEAELTQDAYEGEKLAAEDVEMMSSPAEHPSFMVYHGYTDAETAEEVLPDELREFRDYKLPMLRRIQRENPSFEQWKQAQLDLLSDVVIENASISKEVIKSVDVLDVLFYVLGVITAYKVGNGLEASGA